MVSGVFGIFDSKACSYGQPFFAQNRGAAQRAIGMQLRHDTKSIFCQYPADFALYDLGYFDDEDGLFVTKSPVFVINVSDLMEGSNAQQPEC